ncbi:hypothetical protein [Pseudoalteromonas ulvae]|uniref:Uncharacterized protein n=1 Tax=Pseudoalteromonas ulvae TaxID=107327 RepID=A0A244CS17_PSEDV|nr:hypothetical protein [Pseudoalteromonas ulvae]OUL58391.1 hypothetical protein B1199_08650 [Pseudoalteromonas ulvae]
MRIKQRCALLFGLVLSLMMQGCAYKWVAKYDAALVAETLVVAKQVDRFYGHLIESPHSHRPYENYKTEYIDIEVNLRSLMLQHKTRSLNDESIAIAQITLDKWLKYKQAHQEKDSYKTVLANNHRARMTRLFTAMVVAEEAKNMYQDQSSDE